MSPKSQTSPSRNWLRGGIAGVVAAAAIAAVIIAQMSNSPTGPDQASPAVTASASGTRAASPTNSESASATDSPTATDSASPSVAPSNGTNLLTWSQDLTKALGQESPWLGTLVDAGDAWLMGVVVGDPETGPGATVLTVLDPATGEVQVKPASEATLPEKVQCAAKLLNGQAVCVWDEVLHLVNPHSAEVNPVPFGVEVPFSLYGVAVLDDLVLAAGTSATGGAGAVEFDATGEVKWQSPIGIDGCWAETPESTTLVLPHEATARIGVGSYQAVVSLADGKVLGTGCGRAVLADDGTLGLIQDSGDEPAPVESYIGLDGQTNRIISFGKAKDIVAVERDGQTCFGVLGDDDSLRLVDTATGKDVWVQDKQLGQAAFQGHDDERVYYNTVVGLTAVSLATGEDLWSFSPQVGAAFRTAYVSPTGVVVVAASDGLTGLDPATGTVLWTIPSLTEGAWYWVPDGVSETSALVLINPSRANLYRVDL